MASKSKKLGMAADIFGDSIEGTIRKIKISDIVPDKSQPRKNRDVHVDMLAKSLREEGLLQPIVVTKEGTNYSIVAGERRFRAASLLGWKEIDCRIINKSGKDKFRLAVVENLQRENLNPTEEAMAFQRLKKSFSYTDNDLANIIGKSRNYITEILSIADIPSTWLQKAELAGLESRNLLIQFAQSVKIGKGEEFLLLFKEGELNTVKDAKQYIQTAKGNKKKPHRPQDNPDKNLLPPKDKSYETKEIETKKENQNTSSEPQESNPPQDALFSIKTHRTGKTSLSITIESNTEIPQETLEEIELFFKENLQQFLL